MQDRDAMIIAYKQIDLLNNLSNYTDQSSFFLDKDSFEHAKEILKNLAQISKTISNSAEELFRDVPWSNIKSLPTDINSLTLWNIITTNSLQWKLSLESKFNELELLEWS